MATKKIQTQPAQVKKPVTLIFKVPLKVKVAILFLVAFCFYANTFSNQYALDDEAVIQRNEYVQQGFSGIGKILTKDAYDSYYKQTNSNQKLSGGRYRPLSIVVFAILHQLFGESPLPGHVLNVLLYALCVLTIFYFLRKYLFRKTPYGEDIAFISALLFAIHPLHTEVVANIKSLDEILSLLFIMLTCIFSIKFRETKKTKNLILGLLCMFFALLSKEYAITLLFLIPLLFTLYFKEKIWKSVLNSLPYFGIVVLYFIVRIQSIGIPHAHNDLDILNNPYLLATPMQKAATEFVILGKYLWMQLFPYPLAYDYGYAQIPYYTFSSPWFWLSIIAYVAIIITRIRFLVKKHILLFPVYFYLLNLFIVSNFPLNIGTTMGERLVFHSSLGFVMVVSWGIVELAKKINIKNRERLIIGALGLIVIFCGTEVVTRNSDWKNNFTLFTKDVNTVPNSVKANDNAGSQYINLSETITDTLKSDSVARKGIRYLEKAITLDDSDLTGYLNLGIAYCKLIQPDTAKRFWDKAKRIYAAEPNLPDYYILLGKIFTYTGNKFAQHGKLPEAIHEYETGIQCEASNPYLWFNLGGVFFSSGQMDSARNAWRKTAQINPNYPSIQDWINKTNSIQVTY